MKKNILKVVILAALVTGLTGCASNCGKAPERGQVKVATLSIGGEIDERDTNPSVDVYPGSFALDGNGKPIYDLTTLEYAETSAIALKSFKSILTDGINLADVAAAPTKKAPTRKAYGIGISSIDTIVSFSKIHLSGSAPRFTIIAESGDFKCLAIILWSTEEGSKLTNISCK